MRSNIKIMATVLMFIVLACTMNSCATTQYRAKNLDDISLQAKGTVNNQTVGIDSKKDVVIQEDNNAADELRVQQNVNMQLQGELDREAFDLKRCRTDMSDPRLGGNSVIPPIQEVDNLKSTAEVREQIGLDEAGDLRVVKKSYFMDQLNLERQYTKSIRSMKRLIVRHKEECEYAMGIARRNVGLSSTRSQGEGYYVGGTFVPSKPHEGSLDDAFKIQTSQKK